MDITTSIDPAQKHRATAVKSILLTALLILTFLFGMIPFTLRNAAVQIQPEHSRHRNALIFTLLSCYGGGVFLATCLLDLLPDSINDVLEGLKAADSNIEFPLAEFLVAMGFFLVLFMEQIVLHLRETGTLGSRKHEEPALIGHEHSTSTARPSTSSNLSRSHLIRSDSHTHGRIRTISEASRRSSEPNLSRLPDLKSRNPSSRHHNHRNSSRDLNDSLSSIPPGPESIAVHLADDESAFIRSGHGHSHDPHFDPESHSTSTALVGNRHHPQYGSTKKIDSIQQTDS